MKVRLLVPWYRSGCVRGRCPSDCYCKDSVRQGLPISDFVTVDEEEKQHLNKAFFSVSFKN